MLHIPSHCTSKIILRETHLQLSKGYMPVPAQLLYAPWAPSHPYQSGEVIGEGGAIMKSRGNLKRRSLHRT
jgi:hypothetical protein